MASPQSELHYVEWTHSDATKMAAGGVLMHRLPRRAPRVPDNNLQRDAFQTWSGVTRRPDVHLTSTTHFIEVT